MYKYSVYIYYVYTPSWKKSLTKPFSDVRSGPNFFPGRFRPREASEKLQQVLHRLEKCNMTNGLPTSNLENNYMENGPFVDGLPIFMTSLIHFQLLQK